MGEHLSNDQQERPSEQGASCALTRRALLPAFAVLAYASVHHSVEAMQNDPSPDTGTIWWAELRTRYPQKTQSFYSSVFGWTSKVVAQDDMTRPPNAGEQSYTVFTVGGQEVAGAEEIAPDDPAAAKPGWLTYVQVVDVDEAARKAIENGGKIIQLPVDVPGVGRMAEIEDPEGNRVGLVSPSK